MGIVGEIPNNLKKKLCFWLWKCSSIQGEEKRNEGTCELQLRTLRMIKKRKKKVSENKSSFLKKILRSYFCSAITQNLNVYQQNFQRIYGTIV